MAMHNRTWGEERIAAKLRLKLGLTLSPRTVRRAMPARPRSRGGRSAQSCATFLHNHDGVDYPTAEWTIQQFRNGLPRDGVNRLFVHDRDGIFKPAVGEALRSMSATGAENAGACPASERAL
jgi:hypothetical protein